MKLLKFILSLFLSSFKRKKIDLSGYEARMDYGILDSKQKMAMDNILSACQLGGAGVDIPQLSQAEFDMVITHICMHFGNEGMCKNIALKRQNTAVINLAVYEQVKAGKAELDALIDETVARMYEGSNEYKLRQIADYIAKAGKYNAGSNDPLDLLNGGGMCGAYAMLFYKMATRLGLQAYICYGYASNGTFTGAHAWNKVELPEGVRYYDVTFYDGAVRSRKWLGNVDGWGRVCSVNDKSALRKRG